MSKTPDPNLFSKAAVAAFRREARDRTLWFSSARHFLNKVADALEGKQQPHYSGIKLEKRCVLLSFDVKFYWELVQDICEATQGMHYGSVEFVYLGIFPTGSSRD